MHWPELTLLADYSLGSGAWALSCLRIFNAIVVQTLLMSEPPCAIHTSPQMLHMNASILRLNMSSACAGLMSLDKPTAVSSLPSRVRRDIPQQVGQRRYCCGYLGILDPCLPGRAHIPHQLPPCQDFSSQILSSCMPYRFSSLPVSPFAKCCLIDQSIYRLLVYIFSSHSFS